MSPTIFHRKCSIKIKLHFYGLKKKSLYGYELAGLMVSALAMLTEHAWIVWRSIELDKVPLHYEAVLRPFIFVLFFIEYILYNTGTWMAHLYSISLDNYNRALSNDIN